MRIAGILLMILTVLSAASAVLFFHYNSPGGPVPGGADSGAVIVEIEKGESLKKISEKLAAEKLIRSPLLMRAVSKIRRTEFSMKSGQYSISPDMTTLEIHDLIVSGAGLLYKVTIPEGLTSSRIAAILENSMITDSRSFLEAVSSREIAAGFHINAETLEGYLFPDSYLFPRNYPAEKVVSFMVENFFRKLTSIFPDYQSLAAEQIRDRVILASIIEREYRVESEAPLIASVFFNRLTARMPLGSCATVEYIITEIQKKPHPEFLTYADIGIDSEFNTYLYRGLPPSPISNPGKVSLSAAFNPAESDYLYFLLRDRNSGEHYFSKRLSEHNEARVLYLKK